MRRSLKAFGIVALIVSSSAMSAPVDGTALAGSEPISPEEREAGFRPCDGCPAFVAVPAPPEPLRNILYVAKYELTWREYFKTIDEGVCPFPNLELATSSRPPRRLEGREAAPYRTLDWPVVQLSVAEVNCYIGWLQSHTDLRVALPTPEEWDWFARADQGDVRFPWGNDPGMDHEHVYGSKIDPKLIGKLAGVRGLVTGIEVGHFPPNPWGLYDLMGNAIELTSVTVKYDEWCSTHSCENDSEYFRHDRVFLKGNGLSDPSWVSRGMEFTYNTSIANGRYIMPAALRLVLIGERE